MNSILYRILLLCTFLSGSMLLQGANNPQTYKFEKPNELEELTNKEVQSLYQDRDGYIWIATRNGLFQYDGYSITTYKSNLHTPNLLNSNNINCMAEDAEQRLWIGTAKGLNMLDKRTGKIRQIEAQGLTDNKVVNILVTRTNRVFFATDAGLYEYQPENDTFLLYNQSNTGGVMPIVTARSLMEDARGDIWIGTWSQGLYRYEYRTGKFYKYPPMNAQNSAHVVFQDSRGDIWVGTWRSGLQKLINPYQPEFTSWQTFLHDNQKETSLSDNIIYALNEDPNNHSLWIGTRSGLSVLPLINNPDSLFQNYYPEHSSASLNSDELTSLIIDRQGVMWMGMIGGGVNKVNIHKPDFEGDDFAKKLKTSSVRSILKDDEGVLWMGIGSYGLAMQDTLGELTRYTEMPMFNRYHTIPTVETICQHSVTGEIWFSAYNTGAYVIDKKAATHQKVRQYTPENAAWLPSGLIFDIYEDSQHNLWFATARGMARYSSDNDFLRFDSQVISGENLWMSEIEMRQLTESPKQEIWGASNGHGVIKMTPQGDSYKLTGYSISNGKLNDNQGHCIFCDSKGRIWVGTGGSGLNLYDATSDSFLPVHAEWNLPGDAVVSMEESKDGTLWLGTNAGLVQLEVSEDCSTYAFRLYTTADGLRGNIFNRAASFSAPNGELFFGGHDGYNSFYPEKLSEYTYAVPVMITDIKVYNHSWSALPEKERQQISSLAPPYANEIRLNHKQNNFSIEFSAMSYIKPERNRYAYRLEGFEEEWQYRNASKRFAYYNNLQPGSYTFHLRATGSNGIWNGEVRVLKITILPPPWATWWAYLLYVSTAVLLIGYIYRTVHNRIKMRNALQFKEMEKDQLEELNHAKLQFFTNITHELLTPLTIISASVDELKQLAPTYKTQYGVMNTNINRLIRLLQQILEFRKTETGNLKLRVSQGDLSQFIQRSVNGFVPLLKKQQIDFRITAVPPTQNVYFDTDKLDKILYNLLSNAAKYNRPGGKVEISLIFTGEEMARLMVKDNGPGISKEAQKELFKRFYEGDYRKFKTIGTGIGLSLVRDLVTLHHGHIDVESEEGKGTTFIVTFPIGRAAYSEEEIDDSTILAPENASVEEESETSNEENRTHQSKRPILIVEDNEELLRLMVKLLSKEYSVYTALNGKAAWELVQQEEIDLVISDVMMPEMDGIELCKQMKNNLETSHIPIVLLTAKNQEEDQVEAFESGADGFISKPFNLSLLHARINNLLKVRERVNKDFKKQLVFEAKELNFTSIDEDFLQRTIDCVNRHISDIGFDQTQLLEELHTTKSTFFRKLKSLTGLSYSSFIRNIRMKAACRIMEENRNIQVSELAYAVGYSDPRHFSACFKKEFGMLPSEYMKRFSPDNNQ